jgi:hypothetical protein
VLPNTDGKVLDDEVVMIHPSSLAGESEVFQPYNRVRFPYVLGNFGGWLEARREWHFLDASSEGPWAQAVRTRAPVAVPIARSATSPGRCLLVLPVRLVSRGYIHGSLINIGTTAGQLSRVDDVACVIVGPKPAALQGVSCGGRHFKTLCSRGVATHLGWKPLPLMN